MSSCNIFRLADTIKRDNTPECEAAVEENDGTPLKSVLADRVLAC